MKLYYTPTSPFVRKVLVAARELGLDARIELELLRPSPTRADATLSRSNPLNKIPTLVTDEGDSLYDSRVICEYLGSLTTECSLVPAEGAARWRVLRVQALCDGVLDASILVFYERTQRPKELWWPAWLDGQTEKARQGLDALENEVTHFGDAIDLGQIAAAVTLGWLEFRDVYGDLWATRPRLAAWYARVCQRPSMKATQPHT